jgi:hypothetical protein
MESKVDVVIRLPEHTGDISNLRFASNLNEGAANESW